MSQEGYGCVLVHVHATCKENLDMQKYVLAYFRVFNI